MIEEIAFGSGKEIKPRKDAIRIGDKNHFIESDKGARIHMRETPVLLETLFKKLTDLQSKGDLNEDKLKALGRYVEIKPKDDYAHERKDGLRL